MKVTTTTFVDPLLKEPVADDSGLMTRAWTLWVLPFVHRVQLNLVDTSSGGGNFTLPQARKNQNVEIILKKVTGDANACVPVPSPGDTLDDGGTPLTPTNLKARYISDGVSTWHLV